MSTCLDPVIYNQWHPISAIEDIAPGDNFTVLLGERIGYRCLSGEMAVWHCGSAGPAVARELAFTLAHGYLWTTLGQPQATLFEIPEYLEADRRNVCAATIGVRVSAPRAVENFLDMGHFPFVHTGMLGEQPHTEVREYDVNVSAAGDEILATRCRFYQPQAAAGADGGMIVEYVYRVPHPYCAVLYKSCPDDPSRLDVIALFLQPVSQEQVRAHALVSVIDTHSSALAIRMFQQTIFAQDKPILENQFPVRLPLDPRAETPIRADKSAIVYRRWLTDLGVRYGVIPVAA